MSNLNHPIDVLCNEMLRYNPDVLRIFSYLNGRINPINPCRLYIGYFDKDNFACFHKPDMVTIYLGSIINHYLDEGPDKIRFMILVTVAHELCHSDQNMDMLRYTNDPYYQNNIEAINEGYTERWLLDNEKEIYNTLGIKLSYSQYAMNQMLPRHAEYKNPTLREYYLHTLLDIVYRTDTMKKPLEDTLDTYDTILFSIVNHDQWVILKKDGEFFDDTQLFNRLINTYCRVGEAVKAFNVNTHPVGIEFEGSKGIWIKLYLSNERYTPVCGIEGISTIENSMK